MKLVNKLILGAALSLSFTAGAMAAVTQTVSNMSYDGYQQWGEPTLGSVTLEQGTKVITGLSASARVRDQGWGGECGVCNNASIALYEGDTQLWKQLVAGATHEWTFQSFDIANDEPSRTRLADALTAINWSSNLPVTMRMLANPIGWGGWELHISNATFSVTSDSAEVPEPASIALLGLGIAGLVASRRRKAQK